MRRSLARNSLVLFCSEGFSAVLAMITGLAVARLLRVAEYGKYNSALAFAGIVAVLVDSGMGMMAAKDIARGAARDHAQLNQLFSWRLWMVLAACLLSPAAAYLTLPAGEIRWIAAGLTPAVLLFGTTDFFCWIFKGAQQVVACAVLQTASRVLLLVFCVLAVLGSFPMRDLILAWAVTGILMTTIGILMVRRSLQKLRWVALPRAFFKEVLPDIYRLGAILILSVAFTRVDVMLVVRLAGEAQAGLFSAAGRVIDALRLIPTVVYSVTLPLFSSLQDQPAVLRSQFKIAYDVLVLFSISIALIGTAFAQPLFTIVLPQYVGAVACFRLLVWSCVLMFSNILMFSLLYARNDHRTPFLGIAGAIFVEIVLDAILVPRLGIVGAGWGRITAEFFNCGVMASGILRGRLLSAGTLFIRPALIVVVSVILLVALRSQPLIFQVVLPWGACLALAFALGLGRLPREARAAS